MSSLIVSTGIVQMPEKMAESGIDGQLGLVSCSICPASMGETTHMMFLSNDTLEGMGNDLDSFDFAMQRWFYSNIRPFVDQVGECIFVGEPQKLLDKYKLNTNEKG